jgi:hypothetical protein
MMHFAHRAAPLLALWFIHVSTASAQDKEPSRKTLESMQRHVTSLRAVGRTTQGTELPLKLVTTPVLRYSDPGGITTDASIWVWGGQGRPSVMAGVFFLTQEDREPKWSCELLSLAEGAVAVYSDAGWSWTPEKSDLKWLTIGKAPDETDRQRLRRMKSIAERYEVTTFEGTTKSQLRLLVQPLYRYSDEKQGLLDGAIFSFAAGTNPEALLLVECQETADAISWQAAFSRFGASQCEAKLSETVVWESPAIKKWSAKEPYFSQFGPADRVFHAPGKE